MVCGTWGAGERCQIHLEANYRERRIKLFLEGAELAFLLTTVRLMTWDLTNPSPQILIPWRPSASSSRYPGDPQGQAWVGGARQFMAIKRVAGLDVPLSGRVKEAPSWKGVVVQWCACIYVQMMFPDG